MASNFDRYLSNSTSICVRYATYLSDVIPSLGIKRIRCILKDLFQLPLDQFQIVLEFGVDSILEFLELGDHGALILNTIIGHLLDQHENRTDVLIESICGLEPVLGEPENENEQFIKNHLCNERLYLQVICNSVMVVAGLKNLQNGLNRLDRFNYRVPLLHDCIMLQPGSAVMSAVFNLKHLLDIERFQGDILMANNIEDQFDEVHVVP